MNASEEAKAKMAAAQQEMGENEMKQQVDQMKKQQEQANAMEEKRKTIIRQILDPTAHERLQRIGIVKPEKQKAVEGLIIQLVQQGQIQGKLEENQLIQLLERVEEQTNPQSTVKIQRKRVGDDSDDDIDLDNLDC